MHAQSEQKPLFKFSLSSGVSRLLWVVGTGCRQLFGSPSSSGTKSSRITELQRCKLQLADSRNRPPLMQLLSPFGLLGGNHYTYPLSTNFKIQWAIARLLRDLDMQILDI